MKGLVDHGQELWWAIGEFQAVLSDPFKECLSCFWVEKGLGCIGVGVRGRGNRPSRSHCRGEATGQPLGPSEEVERK